MNVYQIVPLSTIAILLSFTLRAQAPKDDFYDLRVKKILDVEEVDYVITKNNNFKVILLTDEEKKRNQKIIIKSKTSKFEELEIREITSVALKVKRTSVSDSIMYAVLVQNSNLKIGSWEIQEIEDEDEILLSFSIKAGTNISSKEFVDLLYLAALEADRVEELYGNSLDVF